jgi:hypothetical protein
MRKIGIIAVLSLLVTALAAIPALAVTNFDNAPQGAHYRQGSVEPVCTFAEDGLTVNCTGTTIGGVGNTNATQTLAVTSTFTGVCRNPGVNSKIVEPFTETDTNTTSALLTPSRNGQLIVPAISATATSSDEFLADFTCPNVRWTPEVTGTAISFEYTLVFDGFPVTQPAIHITG